MNLLLAIFYSNYQMRFKQQITNFVDDRNNFLIEKFYELDQGQKGYLTKQECFLMFQEIQALDSSSSEQVKPEHFEHIFTLIDESGDGAIQLDEFLKVFEVFELYKYEEGKSLIFQSKKMPNISELS